MEICYKDARKKINNHFNKCLSDEIREKNSDDECLLAILSLFERIKLCLNKRVGLTSAEIIYGLHLVHHCRRIALVLEMRSQCFNSTRIDEMSTLGEELAQANENLFLWVSSLSEHKTSEEVENDQV